MRFKGELSSLGLVLSGLFVVLYVAHRTGFDVWPWPNSARLVPTRLQSPVVLGEYSKRCNVLWQKALGREDGENSPYKVICDKLRHVSHIERFWSGGVTVEEARREVTYLLPPDSKHKKDYRTEDGQLAELYWSDHLYVWSLGSRTTNNKPGHTSRSESNILVIYHNSNDRITSVEISAAER